MFSDFQDFLGQILAFFYDLVPNMAFAIAMVTVAVRVAMLPLTLKQMRSMTAMQQLAPQLKKIQEEFKDDSQKKNEATMAFYKENKVNPVAGCLPLLLQMPIFMALFQVLRKTYKHVPVESRLFADLCGSSTVKACKPKGLSFLGMDLSVAANDSHDGFGDALPYFLLAALVVGTMFLQMKLAQRKQDQSAVNPQMQMMMKIMPVMFGFITISSPAGLVVYFLVGNIWQIGQQELVGRATVASFAGGSAPGGAVVDQVADSVQDAIPTDKGNVSGEIEKKGAPATPPRAQNAKRRNKKRR